MTPLRLPPLAAALALLLAVGAPALAAPAAAIGNPGPPQPSPTGPQLTASTKAGWSCNHDKCAYVKVGGASWGNCFTSWAPVHYAWRPTRYCH